MKKILSLILVLVTVVCCLPIQAFAYYPGFGTNNVGFVYRHTRGPGHWNNTDPNGHGDRFDVSFTWDMCYYLDGGKLGGLPGCKGYAYNYSSYGGGNDGTARTTYAEKGFVNGHMSEGAGAYVHYYFNFATPRWGSGDARNWSHWGSCYDPYLPENEYYSWNYDFCNTSQAEKDKFLAMAIAIVAGPDSTHQVSDVFCSDDTARRAVSAVISAIYYDILRYDPDSKCLVLADGRDPSVQCYAENESAQGLVSQYQHNINQDIITIMTLVDAYMYYEKTGEIKNDVRTGGSAKEIMAARYPEDNLVVPSTTPEVPTKIWDGYISSVGAVDYMDGSAINPFAWGVGDFEWTPAYGYIEIRKSAEDQTINGNSKSVQGITFIVTNVDTNKQFTGVTDENGYCRIECEPGTYTVTEVKPGKYNK